MTRAIALKRATSVPGFWLDPEVGLVAELHALGVHHDQPRSPGDRAAEADGDHRVIGGGVGAHHHEAARLLVVLVGVRGGPRAHRDQHGLHRGRVAEPRAVVDVVGAHDHAGQLLDDVAVLVGRLRGGEGAEMAAVAREARRGGVEGLVPGRLLPPPVSLHHRGDDAVARVHEAGAEAALHAERARRSTGWPALSSAMTASRPSARTRSVMPQPTPQ